MIDDYGIEWEYDAAAGYWVQTGNKYASTVPVTDPMSGQSIPLDDEDNPTARCRVCGDNRGRYCADNGLSLERAVEACSK